jgi:20S proteasome alpha/beta subunit
MMPKPLPRPKPNRLERIRRMTICIGIRATNGIVIAADAEENDGYVKIGQQKIFTYMGPVGSDVPPRPQLTLAFTGAGEGGYIDAFIDNTIDNLPIDPAQTKVQEFLAKNVHTFYQKHVVPFAASKYPPEFEMLIGASFQHQVQLYTTDRSTIKKMHLHAAVGAGRQFAKGLMLQLAQFDDILRTEILAAYIIKMTKERVKDCGKYTSIVSIHSPRMVVAGDGLPSKLLPPVLPLTYVAYDEIRKWEDSFERKWSRRQHNLIHKLIGEEAKQSVSRRSKGQR